MKFSIITSVYLSDYDKERRIPLFEKCIESIKAQTLDHDQFEHIIVNDGSSIPFDIPSYPWIKVINQENLQRITAYNNGLKEALGNIICFLDSDDAYQPNTLEELERAFKKNQDYKLFNYGIKFHHKDGGETFREPFSPQKRPVGHEVFGGGTIAWGSFAFHRSVYDDLGGFPPHHVTDIDCSSIGYGDEPRELWMTSPWDFSAFAQIEFPEIQKFFQEKHPDHPKGLVKELGNPYGNDYYLFYKYTRKYHSKQIDKYLLNVNLK